MEAAQRVAPKSMKIRCGERYLREVREQIMVYFELPKNVTVLIGTEERHEDRVDFVELSNLLWEQAWDDPDVRGLTARIQGVPQPNEMRAVTPDFLTRTVTPVEGSVQSRNTPQQVDEDDDEQPPNDDNYQYDGALEVYNLSVKMDNVYLPEAGPLINGEPLQALSLPASYSPYFTLPASEMQRVQPSDNLLAQNAARRATRSQKQTLAEPLSSKRCRNCKASGTICVRPIDGGSRWVSDPEKYKDGTALACISCQEKGKDDCELQDYFGVNIRVKRA
ncbi:hypothetical protein FRC17_001980 [Serendipita sp. 399]|nr:hypothetical protein FRC17_001980 [Serendipita sp. 399]